MSYLESHVLQEMSGAIVGLRLEARATLNPHAHGCGLPRGKLCAHTARACQLVEVRR
eukprot:COSAG02_NODE_2632_length_8381_cov_1.693552_5_plen_57_part_00